LKIKTLTNYSRFDILNLVASNSIGLELGIASGTFAKEAILSEKFKLYIGIDSYSNRAHDINQYKQALQYVNVLSNFHLIKLSFDQALPLFTDESLDFIYLDGTAEEGFNNGKVLTDWYPKLKSGGIFSGDDYSDRWPLVKEQVNKFCIDNNYTLSITEKVYNKSYCRYPSWLLEKR